MISTANEHREQESHRATILVAEDEFLVRHDLAETLRRTGFVVMEAGNATEAQALIDAGLLPSLLLTDLRMPDPQDGLRLAQYVRQHSPSTKIVVVSASFDVDTSSVADATFSKPLNIRVLIRKCQELTGHRNESHREPS